MLALYQHAFDMYSFVYDISTIFCELISVLKGKIKLVHIISNLISNFKLVQKHAVKLGFLAKNPICTP